MYTTIKMNQTDKQGRSDTADTVNASASSRPNTIKRDQRQNVRSTIPYLKKKPSLPIYVWKARVLIYATTASWISL